MEQSSGGAAIQASSDAQVAAAVDTLPRNVQVESKAAGLIWRGDDILLVRHRGTTDLRTGWGLPGGSVVPGELPTEALTREVREETRLEILDAGGLLYVTSLVDAVTGDAATHLVFAVAQWHGGLGPPEDHDDPVLQARFMPVPEAIDYLSHLPWRVLREPIVAHLRGAAAAGTHWLYRHYAGRNPELVARLAGSGPLLTR